MDQSPEVQHHPIYHRNHMLPLTTPQPYSHTPEPTQHFRPQSNDFPEPCALFGTGTSTSNTTQLLSSHAIQPTSRTIQITNSTNFSPPTASEQDRTTEHDFQKFHLIQDQPRHTTTARYPIQQSSSRQSTSSLLNTHKSLQGHHNPASNTTEATDRSSHTQDTNSNLTRNQQCIITSPLSVKTPSHQSDTTTACPDAPPEPCPSIISEHRDNNADHLAQLLINVQAVHTTFERLSKALLALLSSTYSPDNLAHLRPQDSHRPRVDHITHDPPHPILLFDITMTQGHPLTAVTNRPSVSHRPHRKLHPLQQHLTAPTSSGNASNGH